MRRLRGFFILPGERREEVLKQLDETSSPGFDFFFLVVLSCAIATFGLLIDSAAVIIGAMLVAPLMSPILGLSLASVAGEQFMFRRAILALLEGVLLAIFLSTLVSLLSQNLPFGVLDQLPNEVEARTHPTPFDLGIALAGGAAAAYALAQPRISAALPGVAIATALMPPLCTVGIGFSLGRGDVILGAFLLFSTNFIAISFAGIVVFALLGFRPLTFENRIFHIPRSILISAFLVLLVTVPLVLFTLRLVNQNLLLQKIRQTVSAEIAKFPGSELVDIQVETQSDTLNLRITARFERQPVYAQVVDLQKAIASQLQRPVALQLTVIPATRLDPLVPPTHTPTFTATLTFTPGPSLTPTITRTPTPTVTFTPTITLTPTLTSTSTNTPTVTLTPTSTPMLAEIAGTGGRGVSLRETPAGKILGYLPEGSPVQILYRRETVNQVDWIEVRDLLGRTGWVLADFLVIRP